MKKTGMVTVGVLGLSALVAGCGVSKDRYNAQVVRTTALQAQLGSTRTELSQAQNQLQQAKRAAETAQQRASNVQDAAARIRLQLAKTKEELQKCKAGGGEPAAAGSSAAEAPSGSPKVSAGALTVKGKLDPAVIRQAMIAANPKIKGCYTAALAKYPGLAGKLTVSFTVDRKGRASRAKVTGSNLSNRMLERCVRKVVGRLKFPRPKGRKAGKVKVNYPFRFAP